MKLEIGQFLRKKREILVASGLGVGVTGIGAAVVLGLSGYQAPRSAQLDYYPASSIPTLTPSEKDFDYVVEIWRDIYSNTSHSLPVIENGCPRTSFGYNLRSSTADTRGYGPLVLAGPVSSNLPVPRDRFYVHSKFLAGEYEGTDTVSCFSSQNKIEKQYRLRYLIKFRDNIFGNY